MPDFRKVCHKCVIEVSLRETVKMIFDCVVYKIGRTKKVRITKTDKQL